MNIFVSDECPVKCAKNLDNKRVVKMVLETAQMLSTAINENNGVAPYKSTHKNHPSNVWCRKTRGNYRWLLKHFEALCKEYTARYGKKHLSSTFMSVFIKGANLIPEGPLTEFANCAANKEKGIDYKNVTPVTLAYQLYLNDRWDTDKRPPCWDKKVL